MPFIPHTESDITEMLAKMNVDSIEDLFDEIPADLRSQVSAVPEGLTEAELIRLFEQRTAKNNDRLSFLGAGSYHHHIPAAVWDFALRGEVLTAYTPYQAEASQGALQLLYEYQTMIARLVGMEVVNASLYEGASALAEAILMAVRVQTKKAPVILMPESVHPNYRATVNTITAQQSIECEMLPFDERTGQLKLNDVKAHANAAALVIAYPNFFGVLEDVDALVDTAHAQGMLVIAVINPIALGLIKEPGRWGQKGADIVCGEGQPLGIPMAGGGPYFGIFATKMAFIRQMPGRLVGRTVDTEGKIGYTLTLQAREQHIRRSRATSNICTNQGLLVSAATIYLAIMGHEGITAVAKQCHQQLSLCLDDLTTIPGVSVLFSSPSFHESVLQLPKSAESVLVELEAMNITGGLALEPFYPSLKNTLLVCVTETKTLTDLQMFSAALRKVLS